METRYRFGPVEVGPTERQVLVNGEPAAIGCRAFDLLLALIRNRHRIVPKAELLELAWPGLIVEEANLQVQVSGLRKALGRAMIATIPGIGYQFATPVEEDPASPTTRAPTAEASRSNVRATQDRLIGRSQDVNSVRALLGAERLVTIVGAAGIGKTRVAEEVGRTALQSHRDGVWWVDLCAVSSTDHLVPAIARAVGVPLGEADSIEGLVRGVAGRQLLLILDGCERVRSQVASTARVLLESAPLLHILATGQEPLRMPAEQVYRLSTFPIPSRDASLDVARQFPAFELLEARARAVDRRFVLTEGTVAEAIEICRRLDGLPLAIEMAAARLPSLGPGMLLERLSGHLWMLQSSDHDTPLHHRTMKATLEWSHSLLDAAERASLRRLSTFAGAFRLDSALRVLAPVHRGEEAAVDCIWQLIEKSMLDVAALDPPRYRLLETTRLYALESLKAAGQYEQAFTDHRRAMAELAMEAERSYWEIPDGQWLRRFAPDYDDLQAAFDGAFERGDPDAAAATAEALRWLDLERSSPAGVRRRMARCLELLEGAGPLARARLLNCLTTFRQLKLPNAAACAWAGQRVAAWRALGDSLQLQMALCRLAVYHATRGDFERADQSLAEARELETPADPPRMHLHRLEHAAQVEFLRGDAAALAYHAGLLESLSAAFAAGRMNAIARLFLARAALAEGNAEKSAKLLKAAARDFEEAGQWQLAGKALSHLAVALLRAGNLEAARAAAARALPVLVKSEFSHAILDHVALLAALAGQAREAAQIAGFSDARFASLGEPRQSFEAQSAAQAADAMDRALGRLEHQRLRAHGTRLGEKEAADLASSALA